MTKTCQTCRFWKTNQELLGAPKRGSRVEVIRVCAHPWFDVYDVDGSYYDSGCRSDYSTGRLKTPPTFGCIHHEPA